MLSSLRSFSLPIHTRGSPHIPHFFSFSGRSIISSLCSRFSVISACVRFAFLVCAATSVSSVGSGAPELYSVSASLKKVNCSYPLLKLLFQLRWIIERILLFCHFSCRRTEIDFHRTDQVCGFALLLPINHQCCAAYPCSRIRYIHGLDLFRLTF